MHANTVFLKTIALEETPRPPVWMMRQAGRYLPEYRKLRSKYSFLEMMYTPEIACEVTLQPIRRFGMDAAILFSDILITAEALGSQLSFVEKKGPVISNPIRKQSDLLRLTPNDKQYEPVYQTIRLLKKALDITQTPLIGFAGAPFTVASYMIQGGSSSDLKATKQLIFESPETMQMLLDQLTQETISYLKGQIDAGIEAVQLFDTWANHLDGALFKTWCLPYLKKIVTCLKSYSKVPIIIFAKNSGLWWQDILTTGCNGISLDWQSDLRKIDEKLNQKYILQGNLDPMYLYAPKIVLKEKVMGILEIMRGRSGYIFNLGHGLLPDMQPEKVGYVVELIKAFR